MIMSRTAAGHLGLREIPKPLADLIRMIPATAATESMDVDERFFTSPGDPGDEELMEDWKAFIEPDLLEGFRSAREIVETDLRRMQVNTEPAALDIPAKHADAWLNTLNQARLALAASHHFTEKDLADPAPEIIRTERELARLQIAFYAAIQHALIELIDEE
jgi:hypothetical protein